MVSRKKSRKKSRKISRKKSRKISRKISRKRRSRNRRSRKRISRKMRNFGLMYEEEPMDDIMETPMDIEDKVQIIEIKGHSFRVHNVIGDGTCMFRSLSHQLYGTEKEHKKLREMLVDYYKKRINYAEWKDFFEVERSSPDSLESHIEYIEKSNSWGDHIDLFIFSLIFGVNIYVCDNYDTDPNIILTKKEDSQNTGNIYLGRINDNHYVSLVPI
jgi:hypothetical protein